MTNDGKIVYSSMPLFLREVYDEIKTLEDDGWVFGLLRVNIDETKKAKRYNWKRICHHHGNDYLWAVRPVVRNRRINK